MNILVMDVGGNNVKMLFSGNDETRRFKSGPSLTPKRFLKGVKETTEGWDYEAITVGFPAPITDGKPTINPVNLGKGWAGFDFEAELGKPTRVINDAAMQALGSYEGGRMLFMGLGTGLGTAMVVDDSVLPLEMGQMPYMEGESFEYFVGTAGIKMLGKKQWEACVHDVTARLKAGLLADYIVLGGGNAKKLKELPPGTRLGKNQNAFVGGLRLWEGRAKIQQQQPGDDG